MGWTTCFNAPHHKWVKGKFVVDRKACVDDLYTWTSKDKDGNIVSTAKVLKSALVGRVWYGAVQAKDGSVWCGVCLTCGKSPDGTEWGYKDMDESMQPFYYDCPTSILDILTPTTNERANDWRASCRANAKRKKVEKSVALPTGITAVYRGGWTISSPEYRSKYVYSGVRYKMMSKVDSIDKFISNYGTDAQKAEWVNIINNQNTPLTPSTEI